MALFHCDIHLMRTVRAVQISSQSVVVFFCRRRLYRQPELTYTDFYCNAIFPETI